MQNHTVKIQINDGDAYSHPRDRSLAAYKIWMMEIALRLTTKQNTIELTDAEWVAYWKDYWNEIAGSRGT